MKVTVIDAPHAVSIAELDVPVCGPDDVVVAVSNVGLCGMDLELLRGTSSYLTDGKTSYSHDFGHEWVRVARGGDS